MTDPTTPSRAELLAEIEAKVGNTSVDLARMVLYDPNRWLIKSLLSLLTRAAAEIRALEEQVSNMSFAVAEVGVEEQEARRRADRAVTALNGLLREPYGCSLCDSGKPRNPAKGHQPDCPFELARAVVDEVIVHQLSRDAARQAGQPEGER